MYNCGCNHCPCPRGPQGPQGLQGPSGAPGSLMLADFLTTSSTPSATLGPNDELVFDATLSSNGSNIQHTINTPTISLHGGETYQVTYNVNGLNQTITQGLLFNLLVNGISANAIVSSENTFVANAYNSGSAVGYVVVPQGPNVNISIKNIGLDTIARVNGRISIIQITSNATTD